MYTHLCIGSSGLPSYMPSNMYTDGVVETNMAAVVSGGDMYAEVDEMKKMKDEVQAKIPQDYLTAVNSQLVEVFSIHVARLYS